MHPSWIYGLKAVVHAIAGAFPALLVVLFAGLLALLGLACGRERRTYALAYADLFIRLAGVLVGAKGESSEGRRHGRRTLINPGR